jgi:hypothetical protein
MNILVHKDGRQHGPFTVQEVHHQLNSGSLSHTDYAWHEGLSDWVPLRDILIKFMKAAPLASSSTPIQVPASKHKLRNRFVFICCSIAIVSLALIFGFRLLSNVLYPYGRIPGEYLDLITTEASGVNVSYCGLWSFSKDGSLTLSQQTFVGNKHVNDVHFTGTYSIRGNILTAIVSDHSNSPFTFRIDKDGALVDAKDDTRRMGLEPTQMLLKKSAESLAVALKRGWRR